MLINQEKFKAHIGGVQNAIKFDTIAPFVKTAERDFRNKVGVELYTYLNTLTSGELRELAEGCIAWMSYTLALPQLKFRVGDLGLMKPSPTNSIAITKWEYVDSLEAANGMIDTFWQQFWDQLDVEQPEAWTNSSAYIRRNKLFLRSASELGNYVPLVGINTSFFATLEKFVVRAEQLYIQDTITLTVLSELKEKYQSATPSLSVVEKALVEHIRYALAYYALYEAYPYLALTVDEEGIRQVRKKDGVREEDIAEKQYRQAQRRQLFQDAQLHLAQLRKFMDNTASETQFTAYYNSNIRPSAQYEDEDFTHKPHVIL